VYCANWSLVVIVELLALIDEFRVVGDVAFVGRRHQQRANDFVA
jgi:hypothetical protein